MEVTKVGGWVIDAMADHSGQDLRVIRVLDFLRNLRNLNASVTPMIQDKADCSKPYKWTDEFFDSKVKEVIKKFGGIPCAKVLTSAGYGDLLGHINRGIKCSGMGDLRQKVRRCPWAFGGNKRYIVKVSCGSMLREFFDREGCYFQVRRAVPEGV